MMVPEPTTEDRVMVTPDPGDTMNEDVSDARTTLAAPLTKVLDGEFWRVEPLEIFIVPDMVMSPETLTLPFTLKTPTPLMPPLQLKGEAALMLSVALDRATAPVYGPDKVREPPVRLMPLWPTPELVVTSDSNCVAPPV